MHPCKHYASSNCCLILSTKHKNETDSEKILFTVLHTTEMLASLGRNVIQQFRGTRSQDF